MSLTGEAKRGTDESEFNIILGTRSFAHLRHVTNEYKSLRGHSLSRAIKAEFSGSVVTAMVTVRMNILYIFVHPKRCCKSCPQSGPRPHSTVELRPAGKLSLLYAQVNCLVFWVLTRGNPQVS